LLAGVPNYIGTFWVVHDEESVSFAAAFYGSVASGASLGAALQHARQVSLADQHQEHLTWASYVLYGDPAVRLLTTTPDRPRPVPAVAQHPQAPEVLGGGVVGVLSADVQGHSRLRGEDELATIRTLTAYRHIMSTLIQQHRGRVVDALGDNLLAEFASAVD